MKRLIATLAAVIFSITAGVQFVKPKPDEFVLNTKQHQSYWSPGNTDNISALDLYRLQFGGIDNTADPCKTEMWVVPRLQDDGTGWSTGVATVTSTNFGYWFAVKKDEDPATHVPGEWTPDGTTYLDVGGFGDNKEATHAVWSYKGPDQFYVCAPSMGTIATSHYACDYGSSMDFKYTLSNGVTVLMQIRNAECWYCCREKTASDGYYTANTQDSLKGKQMSTGALLAVGKEGTTITFIRA